MPRLHLVLNNLIYVYYLLFYPFTEIFKKFTAIAKGKTFYEHFHVHRMICFDFLS